MILPFFELCRRVKAFWCPFFGLERRRVIVYGALLQKLATEASRRLTVAIFGLFSS